MTVCRADASAPSGFIRKITIMSIAEVERFTDAELDGVAGGGQPLGWLGLPEAFFNRPMPGS